MWHTNRVFRIRQSVNDQAHAMNLAIQFAGNEIQPLDTAFEFCGLYFCNDSLNEMRGWNQVYAVVDKATGTQIESITASSCPPHRLAEIMRSLANGTTERFDMGPVANVILQPNQKIPATKFEITFHEGDTSRLDVHGTYKGWADINSALYRIVCDEKRLNRPGGIKTDCVVTWADGYTYKAYLCVNKHGDDRHLNEHIRSNALFYTGQAKPSHMTDRQYADYLENPAVQQLADIYHSVLNNYSFTD